MTFPIFHMARWHGSRLRVAVRPVIALAAAAMILVGLPAPSSFASDPVLGSGSTFAFPALDAWMADVARQNLTVNYNDVGSALGRQAFWTAQADFAVSDIPFQQENCPPGSNSCQSELYLVAQSGRSYQYMPIVAGGEAIPYNLQINGQRFTGLKVNSAVLADIFTGVITSWNDPRIAALNPGVTFPNQKIQVVVHSEGAGDSYNLSAYLENQQPSIWDPFANANQLRPPDAPTEYYPCGSTSCHVPPAAEFVGQNGSDGVINYIASPSGNGSIGYDETAYAVESGVPMASIENKAGVFAQPTAISVAVALSDATIFPNHTELLTRVYVNPDPRTYPISSYSYMIVPTNTVSPMNTSKGGTISSFINYFLCQGQQDALKLRYAPLPINLVELGFGVEQQVPGAVAPAPIATCNNPAITGNWYAANGIGLPHVAGQKAPTSARPAAHSTGSAAHTVATTGSPAATGSPSHAAGGAATGSGAEATGTAASAAAVGSRRSAGRAVSGPTSTAASGRNVPVASGKPVGFGEKWNPASVTKVVLLVLGLVLIALGPPIFGLVRRRSRTG